MTIWHRVISLLKGKSESHSDFTNSSTSSLYLASITLRIVVIIIVIINDNNITYNFCDGFFVIYL